MQDTVLSSTPGSVMNGTHWPMTNHLNERAFVSDCVSKSHRDAGLKTYQLFLTPPPHKQLVSILTSTIRAMRVLLISVKPKAKVTFILGQILKDFFLFAWVF